MSMDSSAAFISLMEEVNCKVDYLQKAIASVGQVKASLKITAREVKSQIRDSMSRHLEAMRNRETWLLGQVEVVQHIKEDVLRQQQAELNKALGRLQSTCSLLEQGGKTLDRDSIECRVRETLSAMSDLNLNPEETSAISFLSRNFDLQESIHKFGVVASDKHLDKQAVPPRWKGAFYSPSGPSDDWLVKKSDMLLADVLKIPSAKYDIQDWLLPKQASVTMVTERPITSIPEHPIEHWLVKCQSQDVPMETQNREDVLAAEDEDLNKSAENQGWLLQSGEERVDVPTPSSNLFEYYNIVKMSDSSKWLKKSEASSRQRSSTNPITVTYRKIAASSSDQWLLKKPATASSAKLLRSTSMQSCSECSCGMSSVCSDTEAQEELTEFEHGSSEVSDWLTVQNADLESRSEVSSSTENMLTQASENDTWLLKHSSSVSSGVSNDATGIGRYKENLAAQSNDYWLQHRSPTSPSNKDVDAESSSGFKSFGSSIPGDYNRWLLKPAISSDICKWLARSSSEKCKNCSRMCSYGLFKVFDQVSGSNDGWLMSTQELY